MSAVIDTPELPPATTTDLGHTDALGAIGHEDRTPTCGLFDVPCSALDGRRICAPSWFCFGLVDCSSWRFNQMTYLAHGRSAASAR